MMTTPRVRVIESLEEYAPRPGEAKVFLAGGMHNCPDWRADAIAAFERVWSDGRSLAVFSPRRVVAGSSGFNEAMVGWEHRHLSRADLVLFWFPGGNEHRPEQPIALYELGAAAATGRPITVGVEHDYRRRLDVLAQLRYARPELPVHHDLGATVRTTVRMLGAGTHPLRNAS
ncbi:nucleoside 2-deoxyribosyltransferase domain-containing protein [Streptomyces sp. NPDC004296]|uniref:nucleoside 2-deoxyribosyltransferase domain-containing protein n=1 Tax=Streptomyces sp. NPDC004296 TaxID=3364697 RepID=UPI0036B74BF3